LYDERELNRTDIAYIRDIKPSLTVQIALRMTNETTHTSGK
jgi:hypothetical protein